MFEKFGNKFFLNLVISGFTSLFLGIPIIIYVLITSYLWAGIIVFGLALFFVAYYTHKDILEEDIKKSHSEHEQSNSELKHAVAIAEQNQRVAEFKENTWRKILDERTSGFPSLLSHIELYEKSIDDYLSNYLATKSHPALAAAQIIKEEAKRRREAEFIARKTQGIIEYYESIAPFLLDYKEQEIDEDEISLKEFSEEEKDDPVSNFLTKEEYRKLTSIERNQMALDRYWKRPNKPKWLLGKMYERYVGYLYEKEGYIVEYTGISMGKGDLGRDLICRKGNEIIIIQCKNWSQFKTIFEKNIFQFFGTVFQYRDQNKGKHIKAFFYTTTKLSDLASRFAKELSINLKEEFKMNTNYPCIKCNISDVDGSRIYHLPFDQQYDNTKIEYSKGEFYCATVEEAEKAGFRRAYRWKGSKSN